MLQATSIKASFFASPRTMRIHPPRLRSWRQKYFRLLPSIGLLVILSGAFPVSSFLRTRVERTPSIRPIRRAAVGSISVHSNSNDPARPHGNTTDTTRRKSFSSFAPAPSRRTEGRHRPSSERRQNERPSPSAAQASTPSARKPWKSNQNQPKKRDASIQLNRQISALLRERPDHPSSVEEAERLLLEGVRNSATHDDYDAMSFNLVLGAWARRRSPEGARRADALLRTLLRSPHVKPDAYSYSHVINAYAKSGGRRQAALRAEEILRQMEVTIMLTERVDTDFCHNAVMDCWSVSGDEDGGRRAQVWLTKLEDNVRKRNLPRPTRVSYNICLKAWARSKNGATQAHALLERMLTLDEAVRPDKISYSTCMDAYCRSSGNLTVAAEKAEDLLRQMEESAPIDPSIRPDVVTYTSVLYLYAKAGTDVGRALELVDRMKTISREEPNTTFLNTLMHLFAKQERTTLAESLLQSMKQNNLADKITYTSVISAHAKVGNATRAFELFYELEGLYESSLSFHGPSSSSYRYIPTEKTFTSLIHALAQSRDCSKASMTEMDNLINKQMDLFNKTNYQELLPSTVQYSTMFFLLSKIRDPEAPARAMELMDGMKRQNGRGDRNVRPDATIYAYLINIFTKSRVDQAAGTATRLLSEVEEGFAAGDDSLRPTKLLYSAVLQAYAKSHSKEGSDLAESLLVRTKDLYKEGKIYAKPTTMYYNAVMDGLARSRQGRLAALRAEELLDELEARGRAGDAERLPTTRSYNAAILAWKTSNCAEAPQRAEALLKRMNERYGDGDEGCRPDQVTINTIISVWVNSRQPGAAERAETYLKFMEQQFYDAGDETLKPDSITYNSVLDGYAWSSSKDAARRATEVYDRMQARYDAGDQDLKPSILALTSLWNAWSRSGDGEKARSRMKQIQSLISLKRHEDRKSNEVDAVKSNVIWLSQN